MRTPHSARIRIAIGAFSILATTLWANPEIDFTRYVEGHISAYQVHGGPDLGIAVGDHFTGIFQYGDGHRPQPDPHDGSFRYDYFMADITVDGIRFHNTSDAKAGICCGGDQLRGGGPAVLLSPDAAYDQYFSEIFLNTIEFFSPDAGFKAFTLEASGGPSPLAPNGSSLTVWGDVDSFTVRVPDPVRTDALLGAGLIALLVGNWICTCSAADRSCRSAAVRRVYGST